MKRIHISTIYSNSRSFLITEVFSPYITAHQYKYQTEIIYCFQFLSAVLQHPSHARLYYFRTITVEIHHSRSRKSTLCGC